MSATVEMLCGLTGSGKTVYAHARELEGAVRLSVDEEVHRRYGVYGVDFPEERWPEYEQRASLAVEERFLGLLDDDVELVLDFGLWKRANRDRVKALVETAGATWKLIYFRASREVLSGRLAQRNRRAGANAVRVADVDLDAFFERFEAPDGEGELVIDQRA